MLKRLFALAFLAAAPAMVQAQPTPQQAIRFGVRESVQSIDLSPSGRRVAYIGPGPGRTSVAYVVDVGSAGSQPRPVTASDGNPDRLQWCRFITEERLICAYYAARRMVGVLSTVSRIMAVNVDGSNVRELGSQTGFSSGTIIDWLVAEDNAILLGRRGAVTRVDTSTLRERVIERANIAASGYLTDARGNVRMMVEVPSRGATDQIASRYNYFYRRAGGREWLPFSQFDTLTREGMLPLAVDADSNVAYALRRLNGRMALYRVPLDGELNPSLVYANERVDVDGIVRMNRGSRVIGVTYAEERRHVVYFDPQYQQLDTALGRAIPNLPQIDFVSASADRQRLLIHAGADNDPGRYFIFDRSNRTLAEIMLVRPDLENVTLARVRPVSYPAADGTVIPAYLTLPPGRESARGLPAVVLPHGGPEARDEWGFDWIAQYLAHIGYAVLQPNFRGSGGYGDAWLQQNGFRSWQTSISDIASGARWLASQGIADPGRMAILGWSYGGYAALQAGATEPSLFRGMVAIAPVTDLQQLKEDERNYVTSRNVAEYVGSGPHIVQGSPARNAARITAPVLLFHGDLDLNVFVIHSRRMDQALREAGRQSELTIYEGLEHDLADSSVRAQMLNNIGRFLHRTIGQASQ